MKALTRALRVSGMVWLVLGGLLIMVGNLMILITEMHAEGPGEWTLAGKAFRVPLPCARITCTVTPRSGEERTCSNISSSCS